MPVPSDAANPHLQPWELLHDEIALDTPWFQIHKKHLRMPGGRELDYYVRQTLDSVICVCLTPDNKIVLEKQYRPAIQRVSWDFPAGRMEPGEDPEASMRRELLEEVGFEATEMYYLRPVDADPGASMVRTHIFIARGAIRHRPDPEDTESIVAFTATPKEVLAMIDSGAIGCTFCVSATFFAFRELGLLTPRR